MAELRVRWTLGAIVLGAVILWLSPAARADVEPRSTEKKVVAVFPFTSPTRYNAMGRNAQETFITQLVKTQQVRVIQASLVDRMLRRHGMHWTGVVEPPLLKAAGKWLKADYILAGKLRWGGDAYILSCHVMNVRTLETTMADDVDFSDESKMRIAVRVAAKKIAGTIAGTGGGEGGGSASEMFLNTNPRAFYDTSEFCIAAMNAGVGRLSFTGTVESVDEESKTIRVKGAVGHLPEGLPLDVASTTGIDEPTHVTTVYLTRKVAGGLEARYRTAPEDGIELGARVSSTDHKWTVAVGKVEDEVEDNDKLVERFRSALLEKMSEGSKFQQVEGGSTDWLAKLSNRRTRFSAFKELWNRGIDLVLEGKFYGSVGSRRAHFKAYSTMTGKVLGELKFETRL